MVGVKNDENLPTSQMDVPLLYIFLLKDKWSKIIFRNCWKQKQKISFFQSIDQFHGIGGYSKTLGDTCEIQSMIVL